VSFKPKDSAISDVLQGGRYQAMPLLNAFTVDVEDYYQVSAFERSIDRADWEKYDSRVEDNTRRLLDLLDLHGTKATFFVLGWIARRRPRLVREIHRRGHEVGSHGYWHRLIYEQSPEEFRGDLRLARDVLQDAVGGPILAYRAPSFSITKRSMWAYPILAEEGFAMDSSVFPIRHDRYGMPDARPEMHRIDTPSGTVWEFPMSIVRFLGMNLPVGGGGYFRLYPLRWTLRWLSKINSVHRRSFVCYVHPWELDPGQPRLRAGSRLSRARHYLNLNATEKKLGALLKAFRFGRLCDLLPRKSDPRGESSMPGNRSISQQEGMAHPEDGSTIDCFDIASSTTTQTLS
jgi:polysaccharide deacetylase family protein (PEP-CTERM system associated)